MRRMCCASIALFLFAGYLMADVPNEVTYTGKLKEYGQPVTGTRSINFRIYSTQTGAGQVWETGTHDVSVSSGTFSYLLSPAFDLRGKDLWIETIVSGKTMAPREKITSQFYALHAASAESLSASAGKTMNFTIGTSTRASLSSNGEFKTSMNGTDYFMIPRGGIIMWSGTLSNIPSGWTLCDGNNGTPNLKDRFVIGAGQSFVTNTNGGASTHSHVVNSHTHGLTHKHTYSGSTVDANYLGGDPLDYGSNLSSHHQHAYSGLTSDPVNSNGSASVDVTGITSPGTDTQSNMPPYYCLAFIMKL